MQGAHRRYNPLTQTWVLVSPQRLQRPWLGAHEDSPPQARPQYDPQCYLCPGNERAGGAQNPAYDRTFGFDNDYAALRPGAGTSGIDGDLFSARAEEGRCRVVCFSPRHDLDIGTMDTHEIRDVVDAWADESHSLSLQYNAVTVFENRGAMMGASNPHPHSQIWANASVPDELLREDAGFDAYGGGRGEKCLLCEYAQAEIEKGERVVYCDDHVCVVVPFWAVWPFETLLLPRAHCASLPESSGEQRDAIASAMQSLVRRYDALFGVPFPYSMGWHQRRHLHAHYFPPLLRSADVRKFLVGYELLAQPQRDITAETAAKRLRDA